MTVRAIRGAVQVDSDRPERVAAVTGELLAEVMTVNALTPDDIVFLLFTATPDITSQFPAVAVPGAGLAGVPRMCATEMAVVGSLPRTIRLVVLAEGDVPRSAARHVYLGGASVLAPGPGTGDDDD
ncbi:MAG: chorismate mutase [Kineosporiaceae bacterium]